MAHALNGYDGHCRNIHGHSYKLYITVTGEPITDISSPKYGMVMDFGDLKNIVNTNIVDRFDHALVLQKNSPYASVFDTKLELTEFQPTCENMLVYFSQLLEGKFPEGVKLYSIRMYETASSYAELFL